MEVGLKELQGRGSDILGYRVEGCLHSLPGSFFQADLH
jgi:hypothetical protein